MKAWRLKDAQQVLLEDMESLPVGENCVKVKILYASVAITDRLLMSGKINAQYPLILGREASAMVVEVGENVKGFARGDAVAIKPRSACCICEKCGEAKYSDCEKQLTFGLTEDGMLRDFAVVSSADIIKLPDRISPKDATFIDLIDIAIETVSRLNMDKGQYLVISGATSLGIILAQVAIYYQIIPILADINPGYLELAATLGIYYTVNSSEVDTKKKVFTLTGGKMADAAAYISTSEYPLSKIFDLVKCGGGVAVCGLEKSRPELSVSLSHLLNRRLNVLGICEGNGNMPSAVNLLANHTVVVEPLIGKEIAFEDVAAELGEQLSSSSTYLKTLVKI